jgi:hypothetical protein
MLSFPSPEGDTDDRVTLYDAPADVYYFLKALYDGVYALFLPPSDVHILN